MEDNINKLKEKYSYDEDLLKAFSIVIDMMINKYGEEEKDNIYKIFIDNDIIVKESITRKDLEEIGNNLTKGYNEFLEEEKSDNAYDNSESIGASYNYVTIYNEDMTVKGEKRVIVIPKETDKKEGYMKLFGTTYNIPYILHEANHAYAMQNVTYEKDGNQLTSKHGLITKTSMFSKNENGKIILKETKKSGIIMEEMVNEKLTQDMLVDYFKAKNYADVASTLSSIGHVPTSYSDILIDIAKKFEKVIGFDKLMKLRRDNDLGVIDYFNEISSKGEIASEYIEGISPYDYLENKVFELFSTDLNKSQYSINEYGYLTSSKMLESYAPLCSFQEVLYGTMNVSQFNEVRDNLLFQYDNEKKHEQ